MQGKLKVTHNGLKVGKIYNLLNPIEDYYYVLSENNNVIWCPKDYFELVEYKNIDEFIFIKEDQINGWSRRRLIHDLGEQFEKRYICVPPYEDQRYLEGKRVMFTAHSDKDLLDNKEAQIRELEKQIEELDKELAILKSKLYV